MPRAKTLRSDIEQLRDVYITMSEDPSHDKITRAVYDQVAVNIDNVLARHDHHGSSDAQD